MIIYLCPCKPNLLNNMLIINKKMHGWSFKLKKSQHQIRCKKQNENAWYYIFWFALTFKMAIKNTYLSRRIQISRSSFMK